MSNKVSVGLDIGHSAPKSVWATASHPSEHYQDSFPTFVTRAMELSHEETRNRAMTVDLNGEKYFIGETARKQGRIGKFSGLDKDWITSYKHDALVVGAFQRVLADMEARQVANTDQFEIVVGLPSSLYSSQKEILRSRVGSLLKPLLKEGQSLTVRPQEQAFGPIQELMFTRDGKLCPMRKVESESWGVIEIGQFTTDFSLFVGGERIEIASGSCAGMSTVYDRVQPMLSAASLPSDFLAQDLAIRTGAIAVLGDTVDVSDKVKAASVHLLDMVIDEAISRFGDQINYLDGIIVAGGGAPLLFDGLKARFSRAQLPETPRFSVAEGFCRLGLFCALQ